MLESGRRQSVQSLADRQKTWHTDGVDPFVEKLPWHIVPAARAPATNLLRTSGFRASSARFLPRGRDWRRRRCARLPALAALGIAALLVKDETARFGLNAFKAAGATFAVATLLDRGDIRAGDTLVCASEGNHGRAVARAAREPDARRASIMAEQRRAARVSRPSSARAPRSSRVARHATTMRCARWRGCGGARLDRDLGHVVARLRGDPAADHARLHAADGRSRDRVGPRRRDAIFVPGGVGGLLAAVACWARVALSATGRPRIVGVEPACAACLQRPPVKARPTTLQGRSRRSWGTAMR